MRTTATPTCEHRFEEHVGIPVFGVRAWVPTKHVTYVLSGGVQLEALPTMQRCVDCGEQGYPIPAMPPAPDDGRRESTDDGDHYPGDGCRGDF